MGNLVGLPGVVGGTIKDVPMARTVSGALRALRTSRAVTGAGDFGAWTVWKDDAGQWRCDFTRHHSTINEATARTNVEIEAWLREWLPKVQERQQ